MTGPDWAVWPGERFALGEGLRHWDDRLLMVDILSGRLLGLSVGRAKPPRELLSIRQPLGAVAPLETGGWIAAAGDGIALLDDRPGGPVEPRWLARPEAATGGRTRMNDGVADPHGRFWAGSMAYDTTPDAGSLYRVDPDGEVTRVLDGLTVPNGPAFDATGTTMYLADSAHGVIHRFEVDTDNGDLTNRGVFATVAEGSPDGMTVDADGYLWSAVWGAGRVLRFAPDGTRDTVLTVPARQPTSVCLTGELLVVTSATTGLPEPDESDGAVFATAWPQAATATRPARTRF